MMLSLSHPCERFYRICFEGVNLKWPKGVNFAGFYIGIAEGRLAGHFIEKKEIEKQRGIIKNIIDWCKQNAEIKVYILVMLTHHSWVLTHLRSRQ